MPNSPVRGLLNKQEDTANLVDAMRCVAQGGVYVSQAMTQKMLREHSGAKPDPTIWANSELDALTDRELQVFEMIGEGKTTKEIAMDLRLSPKTIERYKENIKAKMLIDNAMQLTRRATQWLLEKRN